MGQHRQQEQERLTVRRKALQHQRYEDHWPPQIRLADARRQMRRATVRFSEAYRGGPSAADRRDGEERQRQEALGDDGIRQIDEK